MFFVIVSYEALPRRCFVPRNDEMVIDDYDEMVVDDYNEMAVNRLFFL